MDKTEQARLRKRKQRDIERSNSVTSGERDMESVTQYPALLYALADPVKRAKLRRICEQLSNHGQLKNVYYGAGETSVPFDAVNEYLGVLT